LGAEYRNVQRRVVGLNKAQSFTSKLTGSLIRSIGALTLGFIGLQAAIRLLSGSIKIIRDFEQANADLASILGKTRSEIVALTEDAKRLGTTTVFTATQVSKLQKEFAKLGFSEQEILNAKEATLELAEATNSELSQAAIVAASTVRGFSLDASETQRVVDVMAKSFSSSALDIGKFQVAMSKVAPAAKNAGFSLEETTSFLGLLTDRGIEASIAGTSLRKIFSDLSKQGITLDDALEKIRNSTDKMLLPCLPQQE